MQLADPHDVARGGQPYDGLEHARPLTPSHRGLRENHRVEVLHELFRGVSQSSPLGWRQPIDRWRATGPGSERRSVLGPPLFELLLEPPCPYIVVLSDL